MKKRVARPAMFDAIRFDAQGLIPAIIQDAASKRVLTLCYMNRAALERSLQEGKVYVFRRSQNRLMLKGETSGHTQQITQLAIDCEGKSLLVLVKQRVAGCHQGYFSCYFRTRGRGGALVIRERRLFKPETVYRSA